MFPNANYLPSLGFQKPVHFPIPRPVALDLGFPEGGAGSRPGGVLGAAVPETAVDEQGYSQFLKNKIGFTWQLGTSSPARDAIRPENLNQSQFGALVATASDSGHEFGAFSFAQEVGHRSVFMFSFPVVASEHGYRQALDS